MPLFLMVVLSIRVVRNNCSIHKIQVKIKYRNYIAVNMYPTNNRNYTILSDHNLCDDRKTYKQFKITIKMLLCIMTKNYSC